ncbi:NADH-quinone oxidoreductase domain protein [Mycobacterium ulcerans str. Harvey]|uniref:NADH-quinone oxidoreductase domain protein n=1 Tax=Mycobacterium ulcerans str. Harvey TaxID=1299332 RepID=A0ABN0RA44_MYCUL|nr:NADH-quinone oxidoreductase domain protein [Mycobacterium ulcerans str. Harvey]
MRNAPTIAAAKCCAGSPVMTLKSTKSELRQGPLGVHLRDPAGRHHHSP